MPTRNEERNMVQQASTAALEYAEASDRMMAIVDRLGDAHTKLTQCRAQRDELLLSALTVWHSLGNADQTRLQALVEMVNHAAAQKLLASIVKQDASQVRKVTAQQRDEANPTT